MSTPALAGRSTGAQTATLSQQHSNGMGELNLHGIWPLCLVHPRGDEHLWDSEILFMAVLVPRAVPGAELVLVR